MTTRFWWRLWVGVVACCSTVACGIYFPLLSVELALPSNLPTPAQLLRVCALRSDNNSAATGALYRLVTPADAAYHLDATTGVLGYQTTRAHAPEVSRLEVEARDGSDVARMTVEVRATHAHAQCDAKELCFWRAAKYQVFENRKVTLLGPLGPGYLTALCPNRTLSYQLLGGSVSSVFASVSPMVSSAAWSLSSNYLLDRDVKNRGDELPVTTSCTVVGVGGSVRRELSVRLLDENDNPPRPHHQDVYDIYLDASYITRGSRLDASNLIFRDRDIKTADTIYDVVIEDDVLHLLSAECVTREDRDRDENHTLVYCSLMAAKSAELPALAPYTVHLVLRDTNMLPGYGPNHGMLTIRLHGGHTSYVAPPRALPLVGPPPGGIRAARLAQPAANFSSQMASAIRGLIMELPPGGIRYPKEVMVFRSAAPYARLAQPADNLSALMANGSVTFHILDGQDGGASIFKVTARAGILYVASVAALNNASYDNVNLTIVWRAANGSTWTHEILLHLLDDIVNGTCNSSAQQLTPKKYKHCADEKVWSKCEASCGLGTPGVRGTNGRGGCQWRGKRKPSTYPVTNYSTCTPDVKTCPDRLCDALEELHPLICPQDCSKHVQFGLQHAGYKSGISSGAGVCTCDTYSKCVCVVDPPNNSSQAVTTPKPANQTTLHNVSAKKATDQQWCGSDCLVVSSLGVSTVVVVVLLCCFWRFSKSAKHRRERKFVGSVASLSGVQSDYVARSHQESQLLNSLDPAQTTSAAPSPRSLPDPKWEFPRSQLVIEQTLGEGEFGRVLRARATHIGGRTGVTTVAVKTLKEDASSVELADLLSELQLLKEVSHPNVVKLLGACTQPASQPVYVIIEFAQHGSLRNYLRRSRHLETDGRIPCSFASASTSTASGSTPNDVEETLATPCTPRDVLSFAWQISKGMSYLSDIKLVHRDLAARNVLVATGGVCKVSDFGLTRDVYEDDAYLKRSKGRVPVKWMALESLADHMYTSKSDVWSFGILLWELVTLGASPYPGVAVHNLFHLLRAGYRMEKPENCSNQLYDVMHGCWQEEPSNRPSFHDLTLIFERMLEDGVEYLDLNPRIVHNRSYFTSTADPTPHWTNHLLFNALSRGGEQASDTLSTIQEEVPGVQYSTISRSETQRLLQDADDDQDSVIMPETLQLIKNTTRTKKKAESRQRSTQVRAPSNGLVKHSYQNEQSLEEKPEVADVPTITCLPNYENDAVVNDACRHLATPVESSTHDECAQKSPSGDVSHSYENDANEQDLRAAYLSPIKRSPNHMEGYSYVTMAGREAEGGGTYQDLLESAKEDEGSSTDTPHARSREREDEL